MTKTKDIQQPGGGELAGFAETVAQPVVVAAKAAGEMVGRAGAAIGMESAEAPAAAPGQNVPLAEPIVSDHLGIATGEAQREFIARGGSHFEETVQAMQARAEQNTRAVIPPDWRATKIENHEG
jgi:hypothetical protein